MSEQVSIVSDGDSPAKETKKPGRHIWSDAEDLFVLRQFYFKEAERLPPNKRGVVWRDISADMEKVKFIVSDRAVRDRILLLVKTFREKNPKDEWKTGVTDGLSEKEILLLEICQCEEEGERTRKKFGSFKEKKDQKRDRMEKKLLIAATHSQKNRYKGSAGTDSEEEGPTSPVRVPKIRNRFQASSSDYFEAKKAKNAQRLELEKQQLQLQQDRLALDRDRLEIERAREERMTAESLAMRAQNNTLPELLMNQNKK